MIRFLNARLYFIHSLLLCTAIPVYSQSLISLAREKVAIKNPKFYISEIIDSRSTREMVGIVQKGLKNKQEIAQFKNGFQDELKDCLVDFLQPRTGLAPLIVRVLKLNVFERTLLNSETAVAELVVEFYTKTDQGITLVKSAGSTVTRNGFDVTRSHGGNIELCLTDCLDQVNTVLMNGLPAVNNSPVIEYKKLSETPDILEEYKYPILTDAFLVKGVYRNFIEFRDNAPGIIMDFSVKEKTNYTGEAYDVTKGVIKTADGKEANVWGYSDGERIFIKLGMEFFQVLAEDGILWFEGYDISDYKTKVSIPGKSVFMAGFTGFLFYNVQVGWDSRKVKYAINMGNGDLIALE